MEQPEILQRAGVMVPTSDQAVVAHTTLSEFVVVQSLAVAVVATHTGHHVVVAVHVAGVHTPPAQPPVEQALNQDTTVVMEPLKLKPATPPHVLAQYQRQGQHLQHVPTELGVPVQPRVMAELSLEPITVAILKLKPATLKSVHVTLVLGAHVAIRVAMALKPEPVTAPQAALKLKPVTPVLLAVHVPSRVVNQLIAEHVPQHLLVKHLQLS